MLFTYKNVIVTSHNDVAEYIHLDFGYLFSPVFVFSVVKYINEICDVTFHAFRDTFANIFIYQAYWPSGNITCARASINHNIAQKEVFYSVNKIICT